MAKKKGRKVSSSKSDGGDGVPTAGVEEVPTDVVDNEGGEDVEEEKADAAAVAVPDVVASTGTNGHGWTLVRVLDPSNGSDPATACRSDGCTKDAAKVWTRTNPPLCDDCEAKVVEKNSEDPVEIAATTADTNGATGAPKPEAAATTDSQEEKSKDNGTDGLEAKDEAEKVQEVWELRRILSIKDITEAPTKCSNPTCQTTAACIYVSNLAPEDEWFSCLDCQVRKPSRRRALVRNQRNSHLTAISHSDSVHFVRTMSLAAFLPPMSCRCRA
jgi:hypothetical protein